MSKQISTKTTIRNLTAEIKKTFVKKDAFTPVQTAANAAIKSLGVDGNTVNFYTSTDKSGTAAFSVDFPSELFLDQTKTPSRPSSSSMLRPTPAPPTPSWTASRSWFWPSRVRTPTTAPTLS